jgi:hypothetical protein
MSWESLRDESKRLLHHRWRLQDGRKAQAVAMRTALIETVYGPQHPGFIGKPNEVDPHISLLLACDRGEHGRALQIALRSYSGCAWASNSLVDLKAKRRRDGHLEAFTSARIEQYGAVFRAARMIYLTARAMRGELDLGVVPTGQIVAYAEPWIVPKALPVTTDPTTLLAASHNALCIARHVVATPPPAIEIEVPGLNFERGPTVYQDLVAELEGFAVRLDALQEKRSSVAV